MDYCVNTRGSGRLRAHVSLSELGFLSELLGNPRVCRVCNICMSACLSLSVYVLEIARHVNEGNW